MARLPVQSAASLARRLFHSSSNVVSLGGCKRPAGVAVNQSCTATATASAVLDHNYGDWCLQDALKRITGTAENPTSCISCLLWPLASPLLGNAAVGWAGTSGHAYHQGGGGSTDEDSSEHAGSSESSNSNTRRASGMLGSVLWCVNDTPCSVNETTISC